MSLRNLAKKAASAAGTVDREQAAQVATKVATFVAQRSSNRKVAMAAEVVAKGLRLFSEEQLEQRVAVRRRGGAPSMDLGATASAQATPSAWDPAKAQRVGHTADIDQQAASAWPRD